MKKIIALIIAGISLTACVATNNNGGNIVIDTGGSGEKTVFTLACLEGMSSYKIENTGFEFCYDPDWGEIVIEDMPAKAGSSKHLTFKNADKAPELWYESLDFVAPDGVEHVNISDLNLMPGEEEIKEQIVTLLGVSENDVKVRKSSAGGQRAARVDLLGKTITYYVPKAFDNYNLIISAPIALAKEIDEFVFDMVIN